MRTSKIKIFAILLVSFFSIYLSLPTLSSQLLQFLPSVLQPKQVNLGLDLKGGASILLEVKVQDYFQEQIKQQVDVIATSLRKGGVRYTNIKTTNDGLSILLKGNQQHENVKKIMREDVGDIFEYKTAGQVLSVNMRESVRYEASKNLISQSIEIIRRRVDETGTREIDLQMQGKNSILLQVPGVSNPEEIKRLLGKTAKLSFHIVEESVTLQNLATHPKRYSLKVANLADAPSVKLVLQSRPVFTGDMLIDARVSFNQNVPVVLFKLNSVGAKAFADISKQNTGRAIAIVLDGKILSAPVVKEPILGGTGVISGNFSVASANELALLLRSGALPVPLSIIEERVVGPTLGADSIAAGSKAVLIGAALVCLLMTIFYGMFGIVANIALLVNTCATISCLALLGATLTLPGIAGIALTLGMAVDANVLICERIREELRNGRSNISAIETGYKAAFATILDANLTSAICAAILYFFGSGSIRSFAVSLIIGISCSMFTAVSFTKLLTNFWYAIAKPKQLYM